MDNGAIFLSLPRRFEPETEKFVSERFIDASAVRRATASGGLLTMGGYSMAQTEEKWQLFATKADNIRLDLHATFSFRYPSVTYTINTSELADFLSNRNVRGGSMLAETGNQTAAGPEFFANHGVFVATAKEPSLQRFVQELLKNTPSDENSRELRIQKLLDFVTQDIAYDYSVVNYNFELLQRPNETLMSRIGDCSNKTILFASMLEQIGEQCLLAYMPSHICVAVPQGKFQNVNGLSFNWNGSPWDSLKPRLRAFGLASTNFDTRNSSTTWNSFRTAASRTRSYR